ncbi:MAG: Crp/Fnr family transcriptional regulator [Calditrichaeota bacterium]|nr:Crp/Fnr family transcriptional regulator [Calditrichota bacterium]
MQQISESKGGNFFKKGQQIFYEGMRPFGVFCIHQGKVKVYKIESGGQEQIVRFAKEGDIIGYKALILNQPYTAFASALEDATICFIPREQFVKMIHEDPQLSMRLMQKLSAELAEAEQRLTEMAQKPVRERLAENLLMLSDFFGLEGDGHTLAVRLTREDLAHFVGTATETAIRFLYEMKSEGLIDLKGRQIKILDKAGILRRAGMGLPYSG